MNLLKKVIFKVDIIYLSQRYEYNQYSEHNLTILHKKILKKLLF